MKKYLYETENSLKSKKFKPNFKYLANRASDSAEVWVDDSDANAEDLGAYLADFTVEHKDLILKEFGKAVFYNMLNEWYTGDDDDINNLIDSFNHYLTLYLK